MCSAAGLVYVRKRSSFQGRAEYVTLHWDWRRARWNNRPTPLDGIYPPVCAKRSRLSIRLAYRIFRVLEKQRCSSSCCWIICSLGLVKFPPVCLLEWKPKVYYEFIMWLDGSLERPLAYSLMSMVSRGFCLSRKLGASLPLLNRASFSSTRRELTVSCDLLTHLWQKVKGAPNFQSQYLHLQVAYHLTVHRKWFQMNTALRLTTTNYMQSNSSLTEVIVSTSTKYVNDWDEDNDVFILLADHLFEWSKEIFEIHDVSTNLFTQTAINQWPG